MFKRISSIMVLCLLTISSLSAQEIIEPQPGTAPDNPAVVISFPPPVYVVRGNLDIRGTAATNNLANYFIEFRELDLSGTLDPQRPWAPATLPSSQSVSEGVLGTWNTSTTGDGLYEIRLTANITGGTPIFHRVSPVRVQNNVPPFLQVAPTLPPRATLAPTPTPLINTGPGVQPTSFVQPTVIDTNPRVNAQVDANVRAGDSVQYRQVGFLLQGNSAPIIGISSQGSGWYYIELANGQRGFIAPSIVTTTGNLRNLQRINPPATPTPTRTPTPTPLPVTANLLINGLSLDPATPVCNEQFDVSVNVFNSGTGSTNTSVTVTVTDSHAPSSSVSSSNSQTIPSIAPNSNYLVVFPLTVTTFYAEEHIIRVVVDANNELAETNEADNTRTISYTLAQGGC